MDGRGAVLALAVIAGLLLFGVIWGVFVAAATLIGVILLAGLAGDVIAGDRVRASLVLPAGLVGVAFASVAVGWLGLPPVVRLAGVPVIWAVVGATVAIVVSSAAASR